MLLSKPLNPFLFFSHQAFSSLKLIKLSHLSSSSSSNLPHRLIIYHQALISTQHQSRRRRRRQPQPPASPSLAPAPATGVARHSHLSASPLPAHPRPCCHRPIFPSNPSSNLAVTDPRHSRSSSLQPTPSQPTPQPTPVAVASPLQVSALSSFLVTFFNCCFGLIFLGLVLILC